MRSPSRSPRSSDEDIDAQLDGLRQRFATLTGVERAAANGDYVVMDLAAAIDGVNIEEQQANDVSYEVGAGSVLQGLDDALVGMSAGDTKEFTTNLVGGENAGEEAVVTITIKSVKEKVLPELDDEFAQLASEFDSLDELKDSVREQARRNKLIDQVVQARENALDALLAKIDIPLPESALKAEVDNRKHNLEHQIAESGLSKEAYFRLYQTTEEERFAEFDESAAKALKTGFVLDKIVKAEELGVSEQELTNFVVRRAMQMNVAPNTLAQHLADNDQLTLAMVEIVRDKAKSVIGDAAKVTDEAGNEVDLKAIYTEINGEEVVEEPAEESAESRGRSRDREVGLRRDERNANAVAPAAFCGGGVVAGVPACGRFRPWCRACAVSRPPEAGPRLRRRLRAGSTLLGPGAHPAFAIGVTASRSAGVGPEGSPEAIRGPDGLPGPRGRDRTSDPHDPQVMRPRARPGNGCSSRDGTSSVSCA